MDPDHNRKLLVGCEVWAGDIDHEPVLLSLLRSPGPEEVNLDESHILHTLFDSIPLKLNGSHFGHESNFYMFVN